MKSHILALGALVLPPICDCQSTSAPPAAAPEAANPLSTSDCRRIAGDDPQLSPLPGLCEFALTFHRELPDFICEQTITSTGTQPAVVLRAEVTFEKGREQYSNVTIDGKPAAADFSRVASAMKVISAGELGSDLVDLFKPPIVAEFQPPKEAKLRKVLSSVYEFHIAADKNTFWTLRDNRGTTLNPEYEGKLRLERRNGRILRLELRPRHLPKTFQLASVAITIDYGEIPIRGLGVFRLPTTSETAVCNWAGFTFSCSKNVLVFHDCRKFATKSHIIIPP